MNDSTKPKSFTSAIKDALAKKHAAAHPDVKKTEGKTKMKSAPTVKGAPVRKASGRGG